MLTEKENEVKEIAEYYKNLYLNGLCTREIAKEKIQPYLDLVNKKSKEISKRYNQKSYKIDFITYTR